MSRTYSYNGSIINTFDGTSGIIVSRIQHDSSPEVEYAASPIARGDGTAFHQQRFRGKPITLDGAIVGTSMADFEQKLDAFKQLFAVSQGQLVITDYGTLERRTATFEEGEAWSGGSVDATNYSYGTRGRKVSASTGTGAQTTTWTATHDLSSFATSDTAKLRAYISNASFLTSIALTLQTSPGNTYVQTWSSGFTTGANDLSAVISAMTATGAPSLSSITSISLTVTGSNATAVDVTFDDLRVVTTADDRAYDVTISAPLDLPREHFHNTWCRFHLSLTCAEGAGASLSTTRRTLPTSTLAHQFVPLHLAGSGPQGVQLHINRGTMNPARICVADHFTDTFASYANIAAAQAVYTLQDGTFDIAASDAYLKAFKQTNAAATDATAIVTNTTVRDGEIIAYLKKPSSGSVGIIARCVNASSPTDTAHVRMELAPNAVTVRDDDRFYRTLAVTDLDGWVWLRLRFTGSQLRAYYKRTADDDWTLFASGATPRTAAGYLGLWSDLSALSCAHLEVIDATTGRSSLLTADVHPNSTTKLVVDSGTITVSGDDVRATRGSFPRFTSGVATAAVYMPASFIGAYSFYDTDSITDYQAVGGGTGGADGIRAALTFSSGANTYIRQRGTLIYVARIPGLLSDGTLSTGDFIVSLRTTSGGNPTSTIVDDINGNDARVTIAKEDIRSYITGTAAEGYNGSLTPIEIPWAADIPVSASTTYALVFEASTGGTLFQTWRIPYGSGSGGKLTLKTSAASSGTWSTSSNYGYAVFEGNNPTSDTSTPWSVLDATQPTYL